MKILAYIITALLVLTLAYGIWLASGPRGTIEKHEILPGLTYERFRITPEAMAHSAIVDLASTCFQVMPVAPGPENGHSAKTVLAFAKDMDADFAINGSFFYPFKEFPYWETYPGHGDPVNALGPTVVDGMVYAAKQAEWWPGHHLNFLNGGQVIIGDMAADAKFAIGGGKILAVGGKPAPDIKDTKRYPRTIIGIGETGSELFVLVVDGKQFGYSRGVYLKTARDFLLKQGATDIIELDGGGSSTMVIKTDTGHQIMNRMIHTVIPGRQRPVANHIGLRLRPDCT